MPTTVELSVENMHCSSCVKKISEQLSTQTEATEIKVDIIEKTVFVTGGRPEQVVLVLQSIGYHAEIKQNNALVCILSIPALQNNEAETQIIQLLQPLSDRMQLDANPSLQQIKVTGDYRLSALLFTLTQAGWNATVTMPPPTETKTDTLHNTIRKHTVNAALAATVGAGLIAIEAFSKSITWIPKLQNAMIHPLYPQLFWGVLLIITLLTLFVSGKSYYIGAWSQIKHKSFNMDSLIALGTGAAFLYSAIVILGAKTLPPTFLHVYLDTAVMILCFLNIGNALETKAKSKTASAIHALIKLQPETATVMVQGTPIQIPTQFICMGDVLRMVPGSQIPCDGIILSGRSTLNEAMLTGESQPIEKSKGDRVYAGTLNGTGSLDVTVNQPQDETALAKMIKLVRNAQASKPKIGQLVDRISAVFVPVVILISLITFLAWLPFSVTHAVTAAIAVLVIACPCAIGLATPIAIMVGTGKAAEHHILIRNANALQSASQINCIAFDKTGTLTEGKPKVINSDCFINDRPLMEAYVYAIESHSEHALGDALKHATHQHANPNLNVSDFNAVSARGIRAKVNQDSVLLGNQQWLLENKINLTPQQIKVLDEQAKQGASLVLVAMNQQYVAWFALKDPLKKEAKRIIQKLHQQGIETAILSGDHPLTTAAIANETRVQVSLAEATPEDKVNWVKQQQRLGKHVAMVGDGINDAPALTQANIGFAVGSGTEVAIESADITLSNNSISGIHQAITISKATMRTIKRALWGAFLYNCIGILIASGLFYSIWPILLSPIIASMAMATSSVTVVLVSSHLRFLKVE